MPEITWVSALGGAHPALSVSSERSAPVRFELRALVGGTRFTWSVEGWVDEATSQEFAPSLPESLLTHPLAIGVPLVVWGTARVGGHDLPVHGLHAVLERDGDRVALRRTERAAVVAYVPGLYPDRATGRAREGRSADDPGDTGLLGGAR